MLHQKKKKSEVEKRALRHPGLSSAIGGGIESLSGFEMSTVRYVGNVDDGYERGGKKRVVKARLRFSGKLAGPGGAGWAEVEATDWEGARGEEGRLEFDRIFGECLYNRAPTSLSVPFCSTQVSEDYKYVFSYVTA